MQRIEEFLRLTREGIPWALARFNDGEHRAMFKMKRKRISRGRQEVTPSLRHALLAAFAHRQENYWIALPCSACYPAYRDRQLAHAPDLEEYEWRTTAPVLTNRNHKLWQEGFPSALEGGSRKVVWVGAGEQNTMKLPFFERIVERILIPARDAWQAWERVNESEVCADVPSEAVVICCCGPLGRIIAHRWFRRRPDLTVIDAGSIYDPITLDLKSARLHRGELPPCRECH